ncbi:hypothetical protein HNY73_004895 [Argiope bruennichi]|uniref:Uncharacterized protein n=1 Tax=Argiope bruennichi TaxID=94029 RepID=A0A8T0FX59_ARGBR|nr:hypothetical protein HNY73_004895 [Argiope bruennichi]
MPRKDRPYIIPSKKSPVSSFVIASCDKPDEPLAIWRKKIFTDCSRWTMKECSVGYAKQCRILSSSSSSEESDDFSTGMLNCVEPDDEKDTYSIDIRRIEIGGNSTNTIPV